MDFPLLSCRFFWMVPDRRDAQARSRDVISAAAGMPKRLAAYAIQRGIGMTSTLA
jgi:hypothetical protein